MVSIVPAPRLCCALATSPAQRMLDFQLEHTVPQEAGHRGSC